MLARIKSSNKIAKIHLIKDNMVYYHYPNESGTLCCYIDNIIKFKVIKGGKQC